MPRIEVAPQQLHAAGGTAGDIAGDLTELRGQVQALGARAAAACGEPSAAGAAEHVGQGWAAALESLSKAVGGLGSNADAAATAYTGTDAHAIPGGAW
jgi:hypothetical protein